MACGIMERKSAPSSVIILSLAPNMTSAGLRHSRHIFRPLAMCGDTASRGRIGTSLGYLQVKEREFTINYKLSVVVVVIAAAAATTTTGKIAARRTKTTITLLTTATAAAATTTTSSSSTTTTTTTTTTAAATLETAAATTATTTMTHHKFKYKLNYKI